MDSGTSVTSVRSLGGLLRKSRLYALLILLLGGGAAAAFLFVGIQGTTREQQDLFMGYSVEVVESIERTFEKYKVAGLLVHQACHNGITRREFRELYEYLISTGLEFQVTSFNPNTTADGRQELEEESAQFYGEFFPDVEYAGIQGLELDNNSTAMSVQSRSIQPFYFPVHYLEPVEGNEGAIDFDLYSSAARRITIHKVLDTWEPALTPRLNLVQESVEGMFGVILMHPGTSLSTQPGLVPRDFSSMVGKCSVGLLVDTCWLKRLVPTVRIPDLLAAATKNNDQESLLYVYDSTDRSSEPEFLGGVSISLLENGTKSLSHQKDQLYASTITTPSKMMTTNRIEIATREWTVVVISAPGTFRAKLTFIRLGGSVIIVSCACLAVCLYANGLSDARLHQMRSKAEAEKAKLVLDNLTNIAQSERELNE